MQWNPSVANPSQQRPDTQPCRPGSRHLLLPERHQPVTLAIKNGQAQEEGGSYHRRKHSLVSTDFGQNGQPTPETKIFTLLLNARILPDLAISPIQQCTKGPCSRAPYTPYLHVNMGDCSTYCIMWYLATSDQLTESS